VRVVFSRTATYTSDMKPITKLVCAAAVFAAGMAAEVPPSYAYGDAPWCAVVELGQGEVYWDCRFRTVEECVPNVIAGNRGFCNLNPYGPGPNAPVTAVPQRHHKRYVAKHS
jgi:hypothetical protein